MKPGAFGASTEVLPQAFESACIAGTRPESVSTPGMISTSFMRVAGLKKCQPISRCGCFRPCATAVIEIDEVLVASTASAASTASSCRNRPCFTSSRSTMASTTSPQPASASTLPATVMRASTGSRSAASILPRWTAPSRSAAMRFKPLSAAPACASNNRTAWPDCAASCAMPAPRLPAPMTAMGVEVFNE
jgi:hypothetical protein